VSRSLGYTEAAPPERLFHGTVARFLSRIATQGLLRGERQHVHLSASREAALSVGARRGRPIVLEVRALALSATGASFFRTPNGVWLTEHVPPAYLVIPTSATEA
jgi:putative RNA 2'-phosphotransferase